MGIMRIMPRGGCEGLRHVVGVKDYATWWWGMSRIRPWCDVLGLVVVGMRPCGVVCGVRYEALWWWPVGVKD